MRTLDMVLFSALTLALALGIYILWLNAPQPEKSYEGFKLNATNYHISNESQFYPNMRYKDRKISYEIADSCSQTKKADIEEAFNILDEKTILEFYPSSEGEIQILCSNLSPSANEKDHFIAGEGGPAEVVNASFYWVILSGKVSLYRSEKCDTPQISIHEILHTLGFGHKSNPDSILYPVTSCEQKIDNSIIDEINALYKSDSLIDLTIEEIEATKKGQYVDFNITISNNGLKNSKSSLLTVDVEGRVIKDFNIEEIDIGAKRGLSVKNLRVGSEAQVLTFTIESNEEELNTENNKVKLSLIA